MSISNKDSVVDVPKWAVEMLEKDHDFGSFVFKATPINFVSFFMDGDGCLHARCAVCEGREIKSVEQQDFKNHILSKRHQLRLKHILEAEKAEKAEKDAQEEEEEEEEEKDVVRDAVIVMKEYLKDMNVEQVKDFVKRFNYVCKERYDSDILNDDEDEGHEKKKIKLTKSNKNNDNNNNKNNDNKKRLKIGNRLLDCVADDLRKKFPMKSAEEQTKEEKFYFPSNSNANTNANANANANANSNSNNNNNTNNNTNHGNDNNFNDYSEKNTLHVDAFLYNDAMVDELVEEGKMSNSYCVDCGSHNVKLLNFVSHSMSKRELCFIFSDLCLSNPSFTKNCNYLKNKVVVDIGSRLGVVLFAGHALSNAKKLIGVEMNEKFVDASNEIVNKYKLNDRVSIVKGNILDHGEILTEADIVVMDNVFQFFMPEDEQRKAWSFIHQQLSKKPGTLILTVPSLEESLQSCESDVDLKKWVKELPLLHAIENDDDDDDDDDNGEDPLDTSNFHLYKVK